MVTKRLPSLVAPILCLDLATKSGMAFWNGRQTFVGTRAGNPVEFVDWLTASGLIWPEVSVCIEELKHARGWKTVMSLSERIGYTRWTLTVSCNSVHLIHVGTVRAAIGCKAKEEVAARYKKLTTDPDIADALAMLEAVTGIKPTKVTTL